MHRRGDQGRIAGADSEVAAGVVSEVESAGLAEVEDSAGIGVEVDAVSECLHTISGAHIERGESFGDDSGTQVARGEEGDDAVSQRLRTTSGTRIERADSSGDGGGEKLIKSESILTE